MTGSVHAALGAAIGRYVRNKPLAFVCGVASHFAGDVVPHKDVGPLETPIVFGTMARIAQVHGWNSPQFWGALGGILPDFEHIPAELRRDPRRVDPMPEKLFPTHNGTVAHGEWPLHNALGVAMQIVLYVGGLYLAGTLLNHKEN
ncbi:MAG TPA: hypothetical protein VF600_02160 [Abditibacteriaceae bacterium]|jgi:hypothetical protein